MSSVCLEAAQVTPARDRLRRITSEFPPGRGLVRRLGGERPHKRFACTRVRFFPSFSLFAHALCTERAHAALSSLRDEICCVGVCAEGKKTHTHQYVGGFFSLAAVIFAFFTSVTPPPPFPISLGWIRAAKTSVTSAQETR